MHTDLFRALIDDENPRGHPILAGLLYAFCPAAARWWKEGVTPAVPFDLLWQVLVDRQTGRSLQAVLAEYGFENLLDEVRKYIDTVRVYRGHHPGTPAPEILPVFRGMTIAPNRRFNLKAAIQNLGGDWDHLLEYARLWAYVYPDWVRAFNLTSVPKFRAVRMAFSLPDYPTPVRFPLWSWEAKEAGKRTILGLIVPRLVDHDQVRLLLAELAALHADAQTELWTLAAETGEARAFDPQLPREDLRAHLTGLAHLAKHGPYPPLNAYQNPGRCRRCAFRRECFDGGQGHGLDQRQLSLRTIKAELDV